MCLGAEKGAEAREKKQHELAKIVARKVAEEEEKLQQLTFALEVADQLVEAMHSSKSHCQKLCQDLIVLICSYFVENQNKKLAQRVKAKGAETVADNNGAKINFAEFSLFRKVVLAAIVEGRHQSAEHQRLYDERFGLVLRKL